MRDALDTMTIEIPGIEPPPPPPAPKQNQAQRRAAMGFQGPRERPSCSTCIYCCLNVHHPDAFDEVVTFRCDVGDFPVQKGATCQEHKPANPGPLQ